jgi:UDP-N-acetylmuramyl pentapeptide phosphotransferase/UDP-N-acetylglucosamine-1-phosphate transferase
MDGQASVFGAITGFGLAAYIANHGIRYGFGLSWSGMLAAGNAAIAAATLLGLLVYNYPGRDVRSKTFLGDCGSQFYGFVLAVVALHAGDGPPEQRFPWIASLILFSPFIYDVAYTLVRRIRRGERLTEAHRTHLYQRLMVAGWTHGQTLKLNIAVYLGAMLLAWAYAASNHHGIWQLGVLAATGCLLAAYTVIVLQVEEKSTVVRPVA